MEFLGLARQGEFEILEKRSRFIGTAAPAFSVSEAETFISSIRTKYPDATHNVYAFSVGTGTPVDRVSDDGEPRGTAGYPILEVIHKRELRNAVCVVTRYFGGTLLGAGGLLRAYGKAASGALDQAGTRKYAYHRLLRVNLAYDQYGKVQREVEAWNAIIDQVLYGEDVTIAAYVDDNDVERLVGRITDMTRSKSRISVEDGKYIPCREK
ncbi:MAG: YigZ family protein [Bacillota bacterium]